MKKRFTASMALLLAAVFLLQACASDSDPSGSGTAVAGSSRTDSTTEEPTAGPSTPTTTDDGTGSTETPESLVLEFSFNNGEQGWTAGFADLPVNYEASIYELASGIAPLPESAGSGQGFRIHGSNRSDDLFMFLKKQLTPADGIVPGQTYSVGFEIEFASNAPAGSFGIGGSPAESVYLKAGASDIEPLVIEGEEGGHPMLLMNIDKGIQSTDGAQAIVIGNVAKQDNSEDESFALVRHNSGVRSIEASAAADGSLWILVGTDSAFEGTTELFYTKITVTLIPID